MVLWHVSVKVFLFPCLIDGLRTCQNVFTSFPSGTLEPHLSALLWAAMLVSLAIVIVLPQPHGIRALIASTILRLIFSVGLEPTLFLLGAFNVSVRVYEGVCVLPQSSAKSLRARSVAEGQLGVCCTEVWRASLEDSTRPSQFCVKMYLAHSIIPVSHHLNPQVTFCWPTIPNPENELIFSTHNTWL